MIYFWILAALIFLRWSTKTFGMWRGWRSLPGLDRLPADGPEPLPRLSIVVPALNEEATAEKAMRTLLALDYPDLEIIAVNDRSSDRTGEVLDRLASGNPRLRVAHVRELPAGWLGKTHAMDLGSRTCSGEWILFTDADIHFDPTAMKRAVRHAVAAGVDHLVVLPEVLSEGFWERLFLSYFWTIFAFRWQPLKAADPRSRQYIGVGAFNLVRAVAYRKMGGHASMPMEVLDDVKLGKRMKVGGGRQACIPGGGMVRVRWVIGLRGAVQGLTKNLFAALQFNPVFVVLGTVLMLLGVVWPVFGLFVGPAGARALCAATLLCMMWAVGSAPQTPGVNALYGLGFPVAALIFIYIIYRSMFVTYARGGIDWRGTHYPLSDLRKGLV